MKPADLLDALRAGLGDSLSVALDIKTTRFLDDNELLYVPNEILTHRSKVVDAEEQDFWSGFLEQPRTWVHANLMIDTEGHPVVSVRAGPRVAPRKGVETPVVSSAERLRLRVLD